MAVDGDNYMGKNYSFERENMGNKVVLEGLVTKISPERTFGEKNTKCVDVFVEHDNGYEKAEFRIPVYGRAVDNIQKVKVGDHVKANCSLSSREVTTKTGGKFLSLNMSGKNFEVLSQGSKVPETPTPIQDDFDVPF